MISIKDVSVATELYCITHREVLLLFTLLSQNRIEKIMDIAVSMTQHNSAQSVHYDDRWTDTFLKQFQQKLNIITLIEF